MTQRNEPLICRDCRRPIAAGALVYVANLWPYRWGDQSHVHCGPCVEQAGNASPAWWWPARPCCSCERATRPHRAFRDRPPRIWCCSRACLNAYTRQQARQQRAALIQLRACVVCGEAFTSLHRRRRYCSAACRQRAFRQRS
jgi:hypothetical protein